MNSERKKALTEKLIFEALAEFRDCFNQKPTDKALGTYARLLASKFEAKQVTWAMSRIVENGNGFFPSCGEIFAVLKPVEQKKEDLAPGIVKEMIQLLRSWNQDLEDQMLEKASPIAREMFIRLGSTTDIRTSENFETMNAQLERFVKGALAARDANSKNDALGSIGISSENVLQLKRPDLKRLDFSDLDPMKE